MLNKISGTILIAMVFVISHLYMADTYMDHMRSMDKNIVELIQRNQDLVNNHHNIREELVRQETFKRQLECLAMNIYHEARSESYDGRLAVATVTMNRVNHEKFPSTVCGVVWQARGKSCQFSWTCDGKSDRIRNQEAYAESVEMAENVLLNGLRSYKIDKEVYHYHADYVNPDWETKYNAELIAQVDTHKFYRIAYYAN